MNRPKYHYPFLECDHHAGPQRSYVICLHVMNGAKPYRVELATQDNSGLLVCSACYWRRKKKIEMFRCVCVGCATARGFLISAE